MNSFASRCAGMCSAPQAYAAVCIAVAVVALAAYPVAVAQTAHYSSVQQTLGGGFIYPSGIAVDKDGNVFVGDSGNNAVKEIPSGCITFSCVKTLGGGFNMPEGVAVDGNSNVYVADTANNAVKQIPSGCIISSCVKTLGNGFNYPSGIALDKNGNVFVGDTGNQVVYEIFAAEGYTTVKTLGGGFFGPSGVAVDGDGDVFVADTFNSAVKEIPPGCVTSSCVKTLGSGFTYPGAIAVDASGNLFVADNVAEVNGVYTGNNALKEVLASGGYTTITTLASNFSAPHGIEVDISGNVFLTDTINNGVMELKMGAADFGTVAIGQTSAPSVLTFTFDSAGTIGRPVALTQGAAGLDFAAPQTGSCTGATSFNTGDTCTMGVTFTPKFAGVRNGAVLLKDILGNTIATSYVHGLGSGPQVSFLPGSQSTLASGFNNPTGVAVDGSGNVFVGDTQNNAVKEIPSGCFTPSCIKTLGSGFYNPEGVAIDGSGNVFVADLNSSAVKEILAAGGYTTVKTLATGINGPKGIALDGSGNVYVVDIGDGAVKEILAAGGYTTVKTMGGGFLYPDGVAVDGSGNVFVSDTGNSSVKEFPSGCATSSCVETLASGFNYPSGVAVDGSGNVFVADNGAVKEILAAGGYTTVNTMVSGLLPSGVALDGSGNVFVTDSLNNRLVKLDYADPPSLSFAPTTFGSTSRDSPQIVTISNIGNAILSFSVPSTGNNPSIAANFTLNITGSMACPLVGSSASTAGTLAPGASCLLPVNFAPTTVGSISGSLVVTDNNLNAAAPSYAKQSIVLSGTATRTPTVVLSPSTSSITTAQVLSVLVAVGGTPTPTGSVTLTGGGYTSAAFTLSGGSAGIIIPAGSLTVGSYTFTANFTPDSSSSSTYSSATGISPTEMVTSLVLATPFFSVPAGSYNSKQSVTISIATVGATIYYTTNGTTPTTASPLYNGGTITISSSETLEAIATLSGYTNSAVASAGYLISPLAVGGMMDWTWMSGSSAHEQIGVYGTLGAASTSTVPGAREGSVTWADDSGNLWLFGGLGYTTGYEEFNDLWEYSPTAKTWTWVSGGSTSNAIGVYGTLGITAASNTPGARVDAVSWIDTSGNLWLFGGEGYDASGKLGDLNDLWEFNSASKEWAWISGANAVMAKGIYGTLGTAATTTNIPGARDSFASWTDSSNNLWLYGGEGLDSTGTYGILNDLWEFSPTAKTWTWVGGSSTANAFGVYGTLGVAAASNVPGARSAFASWTDSGGNFWLFGGDGNGANGFSGDLNDLWEFSPTTKAWTWVSGSGSSAGGVVPVYGTLGVASTSNTPGGRDRSVGWADSSGNLWLFGGSERLTTQDHNDLWEFSPSTKQWTWVGGSNTSGARGIYGTLGTASASNVPGARANGIAGDAVTWRDSSGNFWLFGGYGYDANGNSGDLNDLWKYQPPTTTPTVTVTPSSTNITAAQGLTVTVTVSAGSNLKTPNGSVTLTSGSNYTSASTALSSASATFNLAAGSLAAGSYAFAASYTPDSSSSSIFNSSTGTSSAVTVSAIVPTITFTSPNHTYGDAPFTIAATSNSSGAITYSVVSGPATISSSLVTLTGSGTVVLQTSQAASGNYASGTETATFTVAGQAPTMIFTVSNHTYGDTPLTVAATSNSLGATAYSVVSGPATISGATATLTGAGTVVLQVDQAASGNYSSGTQTATFAVAKESQTIAFTAPASPVNYGVAPMSLLPSTNSGLAVALSVVSGPASMSGGTLTFTGAGTVVIAADQSGNANYNSAIEVTRSITVSKIAPGAAVTASLNLVMAQSVVTLTATVASLVSTPTGSVVFSDGATPLGTANLSGGIATLAISTLAAGTHSITVVYGGDVNFGSVSSLAISETIQDFTLALGGSGSSQTVQPGGTATFTLPMSPSGGTTFPAVVTFSVSGLPAGFTATFNPSSIAAGSSAANVSLTIQVPQTAMLEKSRQPGRSLPLVAIGMLLLPFAGRLRRSSKRLQQLGIIVIIMFGIGASSALIGCGGSGSGSSGGGGSQPRVYTVTVTAASGTLLHSTTATVTVQ